ncbi:MAG TPA: BtpA/SgcQ family protein [Candidatus Cloacimonadota bacterium]|nr:BtpA/SgcQ family protein [Candidatus Cloacimonadota bacterium]HPT72636.1 BtpA/SgcQ family protein [Candidatus Cloacimonadota bacterium]
MKWKQLFQDNKPIIGMIHVPALPGTPGSKLSMDEILQVVLREVNIYTKENLDSIMIENMHDIPYLNQSVGPEITAFMSVIGARIKQETHIPCGMQILASANRESLAASLAAGFDYIRAEGFVFAHVADEGYTESCAGELLRYRKYIGGEHILVLTDIKKKHSAHTITSDVSIGETAHAAEFFLSDGLIVTGSATGIEPAEMDLREVKKASDLPVIIGSGITSDNIRKYWNLADGFIIGSYFKEDGLWSNTVSSDRVHKFMLEVERLR